MRGNHPEGCGSIRRRWLRSGALGCLALSAVVLTACGSTAVGPTSQASTPGPGTQSAVTPSADSSTEMSTQSGSRSVPPPAVSSPSAGLTTTASQPAPTPVDVLSFAGVHMVSATAGWAVADAGVLYTTDAGGSWQVRNPPGVDPADLRPSPATRAWGNSAFEGTTSAWVTVASPGTMTVFHTVDAGLHWSSAVVGPETDAGMTTTDTPTVIGLNFPTPHDGWLMASAGGIAAGVEDIELYRTADSGATWTLLGAATQQRPSPTGLPAGGVKTGIAFTEQGHGWLTGYRGSQPELWLYETGDGGRTWHPSVLPTPPGISAAGSPRSYPPRFIDADNGVLPVSWPGSTSTTAFYVTNDGGTTWHPETPIESGDPMQVWSWPTTGDGVAASDMTWCVTGNAGQSWHCEQLPAVLRGISDVDFVSPQQGWSVAAGELLTTTDGGDTWTMVTTQPTQ